MQYALNIENAIKIYMYVQGKNHNGVCNVHLDSSK